MKKFCLNAAFLASNIYVAPRYGGYDFYIVYREVIEVHFQNFHSSVTTLDSKAQNHYRLDNQKIMEGTEVSPR